MARRGFISLLILASLGLYACGSDEEPTEVVSPGTTATTAQPTTSRAPATTSTTTGSTGRTTTTTRRATSTTISAAEQRKINELVEDTRTAVEVTDKFWARHWTDFFTGTYRSPQVKGGYIGSASPLCGGRPTDGEDNAFYCPADDYLAWDWGLMVSQYDDKDIGDSFVYFIIAHEWGHAIQKRLNRDLTSQASELQADCLAGASIIGAVNDKTLLLEPGDRGEIFKSLTTIADELEWGDVKDHGSADQRIEAYQRGERGGVRACLPTTR